MERVVLALTLALIGIPLWVFGRAVARQRLSLAFGDYTVETTDPSVWQAAHRRAGRDFQRLGALVAAAAPAVLAFGFPAGGWIFGVAMGILVIGTYVVAIRALGIDEEQQLPGGLANAGEVVRAGRHVLRPANRNTPSIHALLLAVRRAGFDGLPRPVAVEGDGRERLEFIDGEVPTSPYPAWSQGEDALASVAALLRAYHEAAAGFDPRGLAWNDVLADPAAGLAPTVVCHNDVELSNVVFRDGTAVALIDFEFAAPGRPIYDLAQLARLCVPIEHDVDRERMGWRPADHPARLRLIADAYGLDHRGRAELLPAIDDAIDQIEAAATRDFGIGQARAAELAARTGGLEKYGRRRRWWRHNRPAFAIALG